MSAQRKLFLFGAALSAAVGLSRFAVADELPTLAQPGAAERLVHRGRGRVRRPGVHQQAWRQAVQQRRQVQRIRRQHRSAVPEVRSNFGLVKKDGNFRADLHGANIGDDNQKLEADLEQPGAQYLTLGWYKTPQLRSNTAQTIFGGVGSTNLTVPRQRRAGALQRTSSIATSATAINNADLRAGTGTTSTCRRRIRS